MKGFHASIDGDHAQISINSQAVCWAWIDDNGRLKVSVSGGPSALDRSELLIHLDPVRLGDLDDDRIEID